MVELKFKHQEKIYEGMKQSLKEKKRAAWITPTGTGKTFPGLKYIEENPDKTVLIVVPNRAIIHHHEKNIEEYVENGEERLKTGKIKIITYQRLERMQQIAKKMSDRQIKADIVIFDEIHRIGAETWGPAVKSLEDALPETEIIGMTATPERTDRRNMATEKFEDAIVYVMSLTEALSGEKEGEVVLQAPRYVRVISELKIELEEYLEKINRVEDEEKRNMLLEKYKKLHNIVSRVPEIPDMMEQGIKKKNGKYIVFCKDREDLREKMEKASEIFGKVNSNISVKYILSKNDSKDKFGKSQKDNDRVIRHFEETPEGEQLQLLFCVEMLDEGTHVENIDGEIMFAETSSAIRYKQRLGRVMTTDRETVIIDVVNNWMRQIETYREIAGAINRGGEYKKGEFSFTNLSFDETDLLEIMREINEELKYNIQTRKDIYEEIIEWLENHEGRMPRGTIKKKGKTLKREEMTEEEQYEKNLYGRWRFSADCRILETYVGVSIEEISESEEMKAKIKTLRSYGLGMKEKTPYEEIIEWLENHEGKMPRSAISRKGKMLKKEEFTEEELYEVNLYGRWKNAEERRLLNRYLGIKIEEIPESEEMKEKIKALRNYGLGMKARTPYEEIIEWLENHEEKMPRCTIKKEEKTLKREEMTEEELYEIKLYARWITSKEHKLLEKYVGVQIEEIPESEEMKEKIKALRSYGLGMKARTTYEEMIEWLENHEGRMPRGTIKKEEKTLKREEMTEEELYEKNLYARWKKSKESKMLAKYVGVKIEEIPESEDWKGRISTLRNLIKNKKTLYEGIIEWLESHEGRMPRSEIRQKGKILEKDEMTEEENYEIKLYRRWGRSEEDKILKKYIGVPIEAIPESEKIKEKIKTLRSYGLGMKEKTTYEDIIEWLESHEGRMPRGTIVQNGKQLTKENMTEKELAEKNLYARWSKSKERKKLEKYVGVKIEEITESEEMKKKIEVLRSYGLGMKEKTTYEEVIEWLENHEGRMPRSEIRQKGKILKKEEMTEEELTEKNLYARWRRTEEREMLDRYVGVPIEEVPEEWREKIARLRSLGQFGKRKDEKIKGKMKEAVGKRVESNEEVRNELEEIVQENGNKGHGEQTE